LLTAATNVIGLVKDMGLDPKRLCRASPSTKVLLMVIPSEARNLLFHKSRRKQQIPRCLWLLGMTLAKVFSTSAKGVRSSTPE